nr:DUF4062 domain-containing protein [Candidatus Sigynarchaeota archaeon]
MSEQWRTVRVFISSTFRDMHAERDWLVRVVFPELRERCAKRKLHLVDIDLRWGVTEAEAEQGKALEICLDEIDKSRPFFIAILGERYGYVPAKLPGEAIIERPWLAGYDGHSLTALEIVHCVLREPAMAGYCFFYFRDPRVIESIPEDKRKDFTSELSDAARKVAALKGKIEATGRPVMKDYPCCWDVAEGHLVGLENLGARILDDLWTAIDTKYPESEQALDPVAVERSLHEQFIEEHTLVYVGRDAEMENVTAHIEEDDYRPVVITGESGCGKSAFLAAWCKRYAASHPNHLILPYFIGASPGSADHYQLLKAICMELKYQLALRGEIPEDEMELPRTLSTLLAEGSTKRPRIVIVLDGLDQLLPGGAAHGLGWILDCLSGSTRLVASTLAGDCLESLHRRQSIEITLAPLNIDERRAIVVQMLDRWRRKLDERQLSALLAHEATASPLYLKVALEELKVFGQFDQLLPFIGSLAADITGLFDQVLARLENDHGRDLVATAMVAIYCSRHGLAEAELLDLLNSPSSAQLPRVTWARLARGAKAYFVQRGEFTSFFHRQLGDAVTTRYAALIVKTRCILANYFSTAPIARRLEEYPYQLRLGGDFARLATVLADLDLFTLARQAGRTSEWKDHWHAVGDHADPTRLYRAALDAREQARTSQAEINRLNADVGTFLQHLLMGENMEGHKLPLQEALDRAIMSALPMLLRAVSANEKDLLEPTLREGLAADEEVFGPDDPHVATTLTDLASLLHDRGDLSGAEPLLRRALAIREKSLGLNHADTKAIKQQLDNLRAEIARKESR